GPAGSNGRVANRALPDAGDRRTAGGHRRAVHRVGVVARFFGGDLRRRPRDERGALRGAGQQAAAVDLPHPRCWLAAERRLPLGGDAPVSLSPCDAAVRGAARAVRLGSLAHQDAVNRPPGLPSPRSLRAAFAAAYALAYLVGGERRMLRLIRRYG